MNYGSTPIHASLLPTWPGLELIGNAQIGFSMEATSPVLLSVSESGVNCEIE